MKRVQGVLGLRKSVAFVRVAEGHERLVVLFQCGDQLERFVGRHLRILFAPQDQQWRLYFGDVRQNIGPAINRGLFFGRAAEFGFPADRGIAIGPLDILIGA